VGGDGNEPVTVAPDFNMVTSAKVGETVVFTDASEPMDVVRSREWSFGDGSTDSDNASSVEYRFNKAGTYEVELCVNFDYCRTKEITIVGGKIVDASPTPSPSVSTDSNDKNTASISDNFTAKGSSNPSVTRDVVVDETEPEVQDEVEPVPPQRELKGIEEVPPPPPPLPIYDVKFDLPNEVTEGTSLTLNDESTVTNGSVDTRTWTIDGEAFDGRTIRYSFDKSGNIDVKLCLNGGNYCDYKTIRVVAKPAIKPPVETPKTLPIYDVKFDLPNEVTEGASLTLSDESTVTNGSVDTRTWTIDGEAFDGRTIRYSFDKSGNIDVKLCLNGGNYCDYKTIRVVAKPLVHVPKKEKVDVPIPSNTISANVDMSDNDDFYPTQTAASMGPHNYCETAEWIDQTTVSLKVKEKIQLNKATIYASDNGRVRFELSYMNNGKPEKVAVTKNVNRGRTEIHLIDLYTTLYPGVNYRLKVSGQNGVQLENIGSCRAAPNGDTRLTVNAKGGFVLFDMKYRY
jgi:hypothetical protein